MEVLRLLELLKVSVFCPILGWIYPQKTKNIPKSKNFPRNYILFTIKLHKSQVPVKLHNTYRNFQKNPIIWANKVFLKDLNGSEIIDQEVRKPSTTTFLKAPNPGLTAGEVIFLIAPLNRGLCLF